MNFLFVTPGGAHGDKTKLKCITRGAHGDIVAPSHELSTPPPVKFWLTVFTVSKQPPSVLPRRPTYTALSVTATSMAITSIAY